MSNLTFLECKNLINSGFDLRKTLKSIKDQPEFLVELGGIDCIRTIAAINQGGCASGAFMPAVIYSDALDCMNKHGDEVMDYLFFELGEIPKPNSESWSGMAVFYVSAAVELWCSQFDLSAL